MDIVKRSWPVNHPVLHLPPFESRPFHHPPVLSTSSGWCPASRNVWINFGVMRCLLLPRFFFLEAMDIWKKEPCAKGDVAKSLSKFWKYITQQIYEDHKRLIHCFLFWRHFLGSFLFCVWIQSREIWCWYLVEVWAVHLSGKFWWFAAYASGLSVYVRGEILQGGNSDSRRVLKWILCFFCVKMQKNGGRNSQLIILFWNFSFPRKDFDVDPYFPAPTPKQLVEEEVLYLFGFVFIPYSVIGRCS